MEQTKCPGNFRVHKGKWSTPKGMTPSECTYCEWCVQNGCVQLEEGFSVGYDLNQCLCDCSQKESHETIQTYNCGKHAGIIGGAVMGRCGSCFKASSTTSTAQKYCRACSTLYGICEFCGINAEEECPMRPVMKMLSRENGRC